MPAGLVSPPSVLRRLSPIDDNLRVLPVRRARRLMLPNSLENNWAPAGLVGSQATARTGKTGKANMIIRVMSKCKSIVRSLIFYGSLVFYGSPFFSILWAIPTVCSHIIENKI
jgi:hypothetical protein